MLSFVLLLPAIASLTSAQNWSTYPTVAKTASINGFADPIYDEIPTCAQSCVRDMSTGICPYWDTGCLCVLKSLTDPVAECVASQCSGSQVSSFTYLANSLCAKVGAGSWYLDGSEVTALSEAAANTGSGSSVAASVAATTTDPASATTAGSSTVPATSSSASSTVEASSISSSSSTPSSTSSSSTSTSSISSSSSTPSSTSSSSTSTSSISSSSSTPSSTSSSSTSTSSISSSSSTPSSTSSSSTSTSSISSSSSTSTSSISSSSSTSTSSISSSSSTPSSTSSSSTSTSSISSSSSTSTSSISSSSSTSTSGTSSSSRKSTSSTFSTSENTPSSTSSETTTPASVSSSGNSSSVASSVVSRVTPSNAASSTSSESSRDVTSNTTRASTTSYLQSSAISQVTTTNITHASVISATPVSATPNSCPSVTGLNLGFRYKIIPNVPSDNLQSWITSGFTNETPSETGLETSLEKVEVPSGSSLLVAAYFKPSLSGEYSLSISSNDAAAVWWGPRQAFACGSDFTVVIPELGSESDVYIPSTGLNARADTTVSSIALVSGETVPLLINTVPSSGVATLTIVDSEGNAVENLYISGTSLSSSSTQNVYYSKEVYTNTSNGVTETATRVHTICTVCEDLNSTTAPSITTTEVKSDKDVTVTVINGVTTTIPCTTTPLEAATGTYTVTVINGVTVTLPCFTGVSTGSTVEYGTGTGTGTGTSQMVSAAVSETTKPVVASKASAGRITTSLVTLVVLAVGLVALV